MVSTGVVLVLIAALSVGAVLLIIMCVIMGRRLVEKYSTDAVRSNLHGYDDAVFHIPVPAIYTGSDSRYVLIPPSDTCSTLPAYTPNDQHRHSMLVDDATMNPQRTPQCICAAAEDGCLQQPPLDRPPSYMEALAAATNGS